ncbi:hypothetical protein FOG50_01664 [Hanseniaspora uvarum]|nr:hypothetical protein FOG50_01664 [Hanseniaspora uvarum]
MSIKRRASVNDENDTGRLVERLSYQINPKKHKPMEEDKEILKQVQSTLKEEPTQLLQATFDSNNSSEYNNDVDDVVATISSLGDFIPNINFEIKRSFFLSEANNVLKIGRSSKCSLKVNDLLVSSVHLELTMDTKNSTDVLYVKCIGRNGTKINGENTNNQENYRLYNGDELLMGEKIKLKLLYTKKKKSINDYYIIQEELGNGHYAVVKRGINKLTKKKAAIKEFYKQSIDDLYKFDKECDILVGLKHDNIVKLYDTFIEPIPKEPTFFKTFLVMEYANGGELFNRIVKKGKLSVDESKNIFRQLLSGVKYLHLNHIIHRDIKPENVLLEIKYKDLSKSQDEQVQLGPWDSTELDVTVKLADFGLAKFIGGSQESQINNHVATKTMCGSPGYVSPEILQNLEYTEKTDMWSLGVVLYILLCGFPPFSDQLGPPSMKQQIIEAKYAFYSPYWDNIPDVALDLISNLLQLDTKKRFSVMDAVNHPWFNDIIPQSQYHKIISRITPSQHQDSYLSQQKNKLFR